MCLTWILGSRLIRSINQSRATLWVLETCLIVGLLPCIIMLITASLSSNTYNKAFWWEVCFGRSRRRWRGSRWRSRAGYWSWSQGCRSRGRSARRGRKGKRRGSAGGSKRRSRATQRQPHMCMTWRWDDRLKRRLEPMWSDTCVTKDKTSNSVQACSDLAHVVHVGVRRVTVVIVHIGLEEVVVVIYFCVAILFVIFCIRRYSLYTLRRWQ